MEENRFSGLSFRQGMLKSGGKVTGGADPVIRVASTYNNFIASPKAQSLLAVAKGDFVVIYDMAGLGAQDHYNDRFYISKGFVHNGVQNGAKLGDNGQFSFNVGWGAIMAEDMNIKEITGDQLVARNLAILREMTLANGNTQKGYIAFKKATATLVPYNVDEDGVHQPTEVVEAGKDTPAVNVLLYRLSGLTFATHTPKIGSDGNVVEDVDVTADDVNAEA